MKLYDICDSDSGMLVGVLIYYEKKKDFIIELCEGLDEWTAPLLFTNLVKQGILTVPRALSLMWVRERIIPSGRQNISQILKNHKLPAYDEMKFLEISQGRCSQDALFIRKIDRLPDFVAKRRNSLSECIPLEHGRLLCFFENGTAKLVDLARLNSTDDIQKVLAHEALYLSCQVGSGGYYATFNDSIDIAASILDENGELLPLSPDDFIRFLRGNLADTAECCDILDCSRQNVSYLIKKGTLSPVKADVKGNLYMKGDVFKNLW